MARAAGAFLGVHDDYRRRARRPGGRRGAERQDVDVAGGGARGAVGCRR